MMPPTLLRPDFFLGRDDAVVAGVLLPLTIDSDRRLCDEVLPPGNGVVTVVAMRLRGGGWLRGGGVGGVDEEGEEEWEVRGFS